MLITLLILDLLILAGVSVITYKLFRTPLAASTIEDNKPQVDMMKTREITPTKPSVTILDDHHNSLIKRKRLREITNDEVVQ